MKLVSSYKVSTFYLRDLQTLTSINYFKLSHALLELFQFLIKKINKTVFYFFSDLYDLVGNVWEWTRSLYYERLIPRELQDKLYVVKGGSYLDTRDGSANRIARTGQR